MRQANHQAILSPCLEQSGKIGGRAKRAGVKTINNEKWRINNSGNHRQLQPYAADARGASLRTGNIETRNFNALSFCDANIPNSSLLIPTFWTWRAASLPPLLEGSALNLGGSSPWIPTLYELYNFTNFINFINSSVFTLYSLLLTHFWTFLKKKFVCFKIKFYLCNRYDDNNQRTYYYGLHSKPLYKLTKRL